MLGVMRISCGFAWIKNCWKQACSGPMHLVLDVHRAQKTEEIQDLLKAESNISVMYVPGGCTSLVQPVDVSFNKPFKSAVERQATQHMQERIWTPTYMAR